MTRYAIYFDAGTAIDGGPYWQRVDVVTTANHAEATRIGAAEHYPTARTMIVEDDGSRSFPYTLTAADLPYGTATSVFRAVRGVPRPIGWPKDWPID